MFSESKFLAIKPTLVQISVEYAYYNANTRNHKYHAIQIIKITITAVAYCL